MPDPASSQSPQVQFVNEFVRGFSEGDVSHLAKHLHRDFRRSIFPRSLGARELTREEWLKNMTGFVTFSTEVKTNNHSVIEAPGKVIIHTTTNVKTSSGVDVDRESIYITYLVTDEDGNLKILKFEEFTDSQAYFDMFQAVTEAKAKEQNSAA